MKHCPPFVHDFLAANPFAACCTDDGNRFLSVNEPFCQTYRLRPHDVIGGSPWLLASSDFSPTLSSAIQGALADTGWWSGEVPNRSTDGRRFTVSLIAMRIEGTGDSVPVFLGVATPPRQRDHLLRFALSMMIDRSAVGRPSGEPRLTRRQREILHLADAGLAPKDIAQHLGLAPSTVRVHQALLRRRLRGAPTSVPASSARLFGPKRK